MATSDVAIANLALVQLGADRITSMTENSEVARKVNAVYSLIRDEVISAHTWNFATVRDALAQLDETPEYGYDNAFQIPGDCLRVIGSDLDTYGYPWIREEDKILTNESAIEIKYLKRITDPNKFTPSFITAFAARLAAELAFPITGNEKLGANMMLIYEKKLAIAKAVDAQEGHGGEAVQPDSWIDARNSGQP